MQQETRLKQIFWIKIVLSWIMLYFIVVGGLWTYDNIFEPAYVSVVDACNIESSVNERYFTAGEYYPSTNEIKIYTPYKYDGSWQLREQYKGTKEYQMIIKHEKCHRTQKEENRANFYCDELIRFWIDECECYIKMRF